MNISVHYNPTSTQQNLKWRSVISVIISQYSDHMDYSTNMNNTINLKTFCGKCSAFWDLIYESTLMCQSSGGHPAPAHVHWRVKQHSWSSFLSHSKKGVLNVLTSVYHREYGNLFTRISIHQKLKSIRSFKSCGWSVPSHFKMYSETLTLNFILN